MSDLTAIIIFFAVACLTIISGVWLLVRTELKIDPPKSVLSGSDDVRINERGRMQVSDWVNAAINLVIGVLLGSAADGLVQLATTALWPIAVITPLLFAGFFLIDVGVRQAV